jgi:hypothetical protein
MLHPSALAPFEISMPPLPVLPVMLTLWTTTSSTTAPETFTPRAAVSIRRSRSSSPSALASRLKPFAAGAGSITTWSGEPAPSTAMSGLSTLTVSR